MALLVRFKQWLAGLGRGLVARAGLAPRIVMALCCALVLYGYCSNDDMGGDFTSKRGDGKYRPVLARGDGHMLFLMARSTVFDRDWHFDNDLRRFGDPWNQARTATGRKGIPHPIGPALVWAPVLAAAHGAAVVANAFGADIETHGYTIWHQRAVFLTSVIFACGAVLLGRRVAARTVGGAWAPTWGAAVILLGTSLTYYSTHMPSYAHAMDAFASAAFLAYWALTIGRRDVRRHVGLGALLGLAMLIRVQEVGLGIVLALEVAGDVIGLARAREPGWARAALRRVADGGITLAAALVVFVPQLVAWQVIYGDFTGLPQGARFTRLGSPLVMETVFSSRNGWIATHPIIYLGVIGLCCLPRRSRLVALGLGAAVVFQVYLASTVFDWWSSASFGQRRLCNLTLPLVVGVAALLWRMGRLAARARRVPRAVWHGVALLLIGPFVVWNLREVRKYRKGKAAPAEPVPTCCARVPAALRPAAQRIYDAIGNPFQLPASLPFAIVHDLPLKQWDVAVGDYPLIPPLDSLHDGTLGAQRGSWRIGHGGGMNRYMIEGLAGSQKADRPFRWTIAPTARVLVPNLMPEPQRFTLWLAPGGATRARLSWNGEPIGVALLAPGWNAVTFDLPDVDVGTNELWIEATPGPLLPNAGLPGLVQPVGVAVGTLDIGFPPSVR